MAETRKVLGQLNPAATTLTNIYTVPAATQAVVSCVVVCNQAAGSATFRISIAVAGAADAAPQYVYYDQSVAGNTSVIAKLGIGLGPADVVRGYASSATLSFNVLGVEIA